MTDRKETELQCEVKRLVERYFRNEQQIVHRTDLPVSKQWTNILKSIDEKPVTIIIGSTGSGKTTQVPQLLLEEKLYRCREYCRVVVTQPRRIAARSVANTVCSERSWEVGSICGYQVGMDRCISEDSCIQYVTTNTLVEKIIHHGNLEGYTHIIVDEIHERHQDLDCLFYLLRSLSAKMENEGKIAPKIILMSATAESKIYSNYFGQFRVNVVSVEGRMHHVEKIYLDDLSADLRHELQPVMVTEKRADWSGHLVQEQSKPGVTLMQLKAVVRLVATFDQNESKNNASKGAVLIFLPGLSDIKALARCFDAAQDNRVVLITLHSKAPMEEQNRAFKKVPPSRRKIIIATNIAESSITVPDIRYVIDFCLTKSQVVDRNSGFASFQIEFCSRASCDQRAGRAGRVQKGVVYRLLHRIDYDLLPEYSEPDILRSPIDITVLKLKKFGLSKPKEVLANFISPPRTEDVARAIVKLKEVQALQLEHNGRVDLDDGDLTILGQVMASLPLDVRLSKLILMGFAFGCFEETVKMAACLSVEDLLVQTPDSMSMYEARLYWARGHYSDPILLMNAFDDYLTFIRTATVAVDLDSQKRWASSRGLELRRLTEVQFLYEELKDRLSHIGFSKPDGPNRTSRDPHVQNFFLLMALCGAFYPNFYVQKDIDYYRIREQVGDNNPLTTMVINNMPYEYGQLYCQAIRAKLRDCLRGDEEFEFKGSNAFILFKTNDVAHVPPNVYLCQKYFLIHRKMELPRILPEYARRLLQQIEQTENPSGERGDRVKVISLTQKIQSEQPKLREPPLPSRADFEALISWWDNENVFQFYLQLAERSTQLENLLNEIDDYFKSGSNRPEVVDEVKEGMIVLAEYQAALYRAKVVSVSNGNIKVSYIDYGNTAFVEHVYHIPMSLVLANHEAPFAYKTQLAKVQSHDGKPIKPTTFYKLQVSKPCRVELYSVVHDVLRVDLFVVSLGEEVHINERLRYERVAVLLDEPTISQESHECDIHPEHGVAANGLGRCILRGEFYTSANEHCNGTETFSAPFSPLAKECKLGTLKRNNQVKGIYIVEQSVNHIMFGDTGPQRRFVVGHSERLSSDRRIQLLRTTLMPKLNMMLPFVALIFSPRAEYRCNDERTAYVGAICGLGGLENEDGTVESACPESDLEVPFSHELGRQDVKLINRIRNLLNEAFCGNNKVFEWTSVPTLRIQDKLIQKITKFFNNEKRPQLKSVDHSNDWEHKFKWSKITKQYDSQDQANLRQALFRPHCIVPIGTKKMFKLLSQMCDFMEAAKGFDHKQIMMCPLCVEVFGSRGEAQSHLQKESHRVQFEKLRGFSSVEAL